MNFTNLSFEKWFKQNPKPKKWKGGQTNQLLVFITWELNSVQDPKVYLIMLLKNVRGSVKETAVIKDFFSKLLSELPTDLAPKPSADPINLQVAVDQLSAKLLGE